jgi:hypothetical protein
LLHEIGEHYGLEGMLGKDYISSLNRLKTLKNTDETVSKIWNEVTQLYPEFEVGSVPFLQEVMAKVGEQAPNNSVFRRIVGLVKEFLRKLGLYDVNKFTTADIQDMILYSLRTSLAETSSREQVSSTPAVQMSKEGETSGFTEKTIKKLVEAYGNTGVDTATEGYITFMSPQEFLDLATTPEDIARVEKEVRQGVGSSRDLNAEGQFDVSAMKKLFEGDVSQSSPMYLQVSGLFKRPTTPEDAGHKLNYTSKAIDPDIGDVKVSGHEGRHRAIMMRDAGITRIPVVIQSSGTGVIRNVIRSMFLRPFKPSGKGIFLSNVQPLSYANEQKLINSDIASGDIQFSREEPPGGHNPVQYSKMMEFAGKQYTNIPTGTKKTIEGILDKVLELPTTLRAAWMGMLGLQNMADLYGKYLSSIQPLISILEKRAALTSKLRSEVDVLGFLGTRVVQGVKGRKVAEYNPKTKKLEVSDTKTTDQVYTEGQLKRWQQIVYDLSRENIDPRDMSVENQAIPLVVAFNNQPKELRDLALGYTARFEAYGDQYFEALKNNIPDNADKAANIQRLNEQFKNRLKFYHPFRRKGAYRIEYIPKGETEQSIIRVETLREAEKEIQKIKARGDEFRANTYIPNTSRRAEYPPSEFMKQVIDKLETSKVPQETIDEIYEYYLDLFPSDSIRQLMRKRQGTRGEIQDVVGGFTDVGARMASQISNLTYIPQIDKITNQITEEANIAQKTIDNMDMDPRKKERLKSSVANAARELNGPDSKSFMHNPVAGRLSSFGSYISYVASIAGNVSSAVVNLSQLALIVFPMLAGKYGVGKATRIIGEAIKLYFSGGKDNNRGLTVFGANLSDISFGMKNGVLRSEENYKKGLIKKEDVLSQDLLDLYEVGVNNSVFNRGIGYELTELRKVNAEDFTGTKAKFDTIMGWLFQNSERFNREVTFLAGYLAEKDTGSSADKSLKSAIEFTRRTHGTALSEIGPRFFQTGFGKTAFTFKRFAHAMLSLIIKLGNEAFRGESKEVRNLARKQLLGIYGMSFITSGLQGVPLYGATQVLSEMLYAMFGDDDEDYNFDKEVMDIFGDIGYKGPLNKLLDTDIASRTGFSNLIWRDDPRRIEEIGLPGYMLEMSLGPSYSYLRSIGRGVEDMSQGNWQRGFEAATPAVIRNALKSYRFATEGALTRKGAPLVDDLNTYNVFMQIFGFSNEDLALNYEKNNMAKQAEKNIIARRSGLLNAAFFARQNDDFDLLADIQEKIDDFNDSSLGQLNPITGSTLSKSFKNKTNNINDSVNGININKKYRDALEEEYNK